MSEIVDGFCRDLLEDHEQGIRLDPETVAARFVSWFGVSAIPTLDELTGLARRTGLGEVLEGRKMDGLKGAHIGQPGGEYHIYYRDDLWEGSKAQTLAHEIYEIILENMGVKDSGGPPDPLVCLQAERFAVAVLMQPGVFAPCAQNCGLDVVALHERFGSSYASAALRLAEVVRVPPLLVVLYGHSEKGDPALWPAGDDLARLRAKVVRRTRGFRARRSQITGGWRGGMPHKDQAIPPGSLAELAAQSGETECAKADGIAAAATPVIWKGRLAKVAVVAVPAEYRAALEPQLGRQGWRPDTRNSRITALAQR
ncbi:MAG: ImmA/IrrE family metallo-endopeptidase [Acidobacteria bacterium]|nr:ImmA/IrrE family metallo-endopeptidase [Acidobacteriota bacterium]